LADNDGFWWKYLFMGQSAPIEIAGHSYSPETIDLLRAVLDETWAKLSPLQQTQLPRSKIADRLLKAAAEGERDPDMLRLRALDGLAVETPAEKTLPASR
jgi:hypothetical protein